MDEAPSQETPPGVPTWVKALGVAALLAALLFLALHLLTGNTMRH